ncbi:MAG: molecular chaperone DnaJ [Mycobacteriales bacterium]
MSTRDYVEKDYYKALGVAKGASQTDIKKAYRKLARELHPDANPGDAKAEARFKEVSEAYSVLSDEKSRKEYDQARRLFSGGFPGFGGGRGGTDGGGFGFPSGSSDGTGFDFGDLFGGGGPSGSGSRVSDMFGGLFGGGRGRTRTGTPIKGADVETEFNLSFDDAVEGVTVPLRLASPHACPTCGGSGARPGTTPQTCPVCHGQGVTTRNQGAFAFSEPCRDCRGTGQIITDPCPDCHGTGQQDGVRTITVRIPAGVKDGQRIRIAGKGAPGERGGRSGDLFVVVHVKDHPMFGRSGDDLTLTLPVTFPEAALGATVTVPTLHGSVSLKLPAGTANGRTFRVRGKGVERTSRKGDLLVTVEVAVPKSLTPGARAALESFASAQAEDPRSALNAQVHSHG